MQNTLQLTPVGNMVGILQLHYPILCYNKQLVVFSFHYKFPASALQMLSHLFCLQHTNEMVCHKWEWSRQERSVTVFSIIQMILMPQQSMSVTP